MVEKDTNVNIVDIDRKKGKAINTGDAGVKDTTSSSSEKVDKDFYIENGFYVFTAAFHLKRGSCCKSGCRHCPYDFKRDI